jgi:hypothetical protein
LRAWRTDVTESDVHGGGAGAPSVGADDLEPIGAGLGTYQLRLDAGFVGEEDIELEELAVGGSDSDPRCGAEVAPFDSEEILRELECGPCNAGRAKRNTGLSPRERRNDEKCHDNAEIERWSSHEPYPILEEGESNLPTSCPRRNATGGARKKPRLRPRFGKILTATSFRGLSATRTRFLREPSVAGSFHGERAVIHCRRAESIGDSLGESTCSQYNACRESSE